MRAVLLALVLLLAVTPSAVARPGDLDRGFGDDGWLVGVAPPETIEAMTRLPDGRILIVGIEEQYANTLALRRLLPDGSSDPSFGRNGVAVTGVSRTNDAHLVVQPDGRIVVAGTLRRPPEEDHVVYLERYLPDGTLDAGFGRGGGREVHAQLDAESEDITAIEGLPDGRILVGGSSDAGQDSFFVLRLGRDGALDPTFAGDGRLLLPHGGDYPAWPSDLVATDDGRVYALGAAEPPRSYPDRSAVHVPAAVRLSQDGALDPAFGDGGLAALPNPDDEGRLTRGIALSDDRLVVLQQQLTEGYPLSGVILRRLTATGRLDRTFGTRGKGRIEIADNEFDYGRLFGRELVRQPDGKYLVAASLVSCPDRGQSCDTFVALARFGGEGRPDREFGQRGVAVLRDGPPIADFFGRFSTHVAGDALVLGADEQPLLGAATFAFRENEYHSAYVLGRLLDTVAPELTAPLPRTHRGARIRVDAACVREVTGTCHVRLRLVGTRRVRGRLRAYEAVDRRFRVKVAAPRTLQARLRRLARRRLANRGRLRLRATLTVSDSNGNSLTRARRVVIRPAAAAVARAATPAGFFGMHADQAFAQRGEERAETLAAVRATGARVVRQQLAWSRVERERGVYDWSEFDDYVEAVARTGLDLVPILIEPPQFRSRAPGRPDRGVYPPRRWRAFGAFAALAVERYGTGGSFWAEHPDVPLRPVRSWHVWNEPSLAYFWRPKPNARRFGSMLRVVAGAIRAADPRAQVVAPALPESRYGIPLIRYLSRMSATAGRSGYDVVAVNPYARTVGEMMRLLRRTRHWLDRHRRRRTPILVAEFGWASFDGPSERRQADRIEAAVARLTRERRRLRLSGALHYSWQDATPFPGGPDFWGIHTGLYDLYGRAKPAHEAFEKAVARAGGV
jgi:uncharacterized delta-60 repeat protein